MRTRRYLATFQGMTIIGMLVLGACGGGGSSSGGGTLGTDSASPMSVTLVVPTTDISGGDSLPVTAQVLGSTNTDVSWTVNEIANGDESTGTITGEGNGAGNTVTYVAPAIEGSYDLTAKSVVNPAKSASVRVRVRKSATVTVAVSPTTFSLLQGTQKQFTAIVTGSGQYNHNVTWSAQLGSITSTGLYTAPATSGTDVVIAKSLQDLSKSTTASVTVTDANTAPMEVVGFGKNTTGGANYSEVHVTNLNDSGAGSFRASLGSNRRIVFDVGGTIALTSANIDVSNITNLTIDGTNAPGSGITFAQRGMWFRNSSNIIIRNIRHRGGYDAGPETGPNITFFPNCTNVLLDHCSFSGFSDSGINFWSNIHEVTIMNCLVGPGINAGHNFPVLISEKCYNVTMVHTLIYGGDYRNPAVGWADNDNPTYPQAAPAIVADIVNNLIYKYIGYGTSIYWGAKANVRGNFYWSNSGGTAFEVGDPYHLAQAYCDGNYHKDGGSISGNVGSPFSIPTAAQVTATSAAAAANYVVANAGCRAGGLDAYDQAIINAIVL